MSDICSNGAHKHNEQHTAGGCHEYIAPGYNAMDDTGQPALHTWQPCLDATPIADTALQTAPLPKNLTHKPGGNILWLCAWKLLWEGAHTGYWLVVKRCLYADITACMKHAVLSFRNTNDN